MNHNLVGAAEYEYDQFGMPQASNYGGSMIYGGGVSVANAMPQAAASLVEMCSQGAMCRDKNCPL